MVKRPLCFSLSMMALLWGVTSFPVLQAAPLPDTLDSLADRARECVKRTQWTEACRLYDEILKRDRNFPQARDQYQLCLRHIHQGRRHRDDSFRQVLLKLPPIPAADVYEDVLNKLRNHYIDRNQVDITVLFQQGLDEFHFALVDEVFVKQHLTAFSREKIDDFRSQLEPWRSKKLSTTGEARAQVLAVAVAARRSLGLEPAVVIFEFACGACNGLDEYTAYLTPGQWNDIQASLKGELAGVGIHVALIDQRLLIAQVHPDSDAFEKRLRPGDRILQIDRQMVEHLTPEEAAARLQGEPGSKVEIVVIPLGEAAPRTYKVVRRPVMVRSVEFELIQEETNRIGLVRLLGFHENTVQEVRDALLQLQSMGAAVLIVDLRGNPGGLFRPAIQVAEMFLSEGVIVLTQSRLRSYNRTYKADNPNPVELPLVVLVDAETASAAEVLAGALKENQRATLVGQATFGKGSIQAVLPLEKIPAGLRITVARFYSPANYPYSGRGVTPHEVVDAGPEAQLAAARAVAQRLAMMMGR